MLNMKKMHPVVSKELSRTDWLTDRDDSNIPHRFTGIIKQLSSLKKGDVVLYHGMVAYNIVVNDTMKS